MAQAWPLKKWISTPFSQHSTWLYFSPLTLAARVVQSASLHSAGGKKFYYLFILLSDAHVYACVRVCVYARAHCMWAYMCARMCMLAPVWVYGGQKYTLISIMIYLSFWDRILSSNPYLIILARLASQGALGFIGVSTSPEQGLQICITTCFLIWVLEICIQVLMLVQKVLYVQSHNPNP